MKRFGVCIFVLLFAATARAENEIVKFPVTEPSGITTTLTATLSKPDGEGPFPAVVVLHGCGGELPTEKWLESFIGPLGYVSLRINSLWPRGYINICEDFPADVSSRVRALDAHAGKDYLASLSYVDADRIGVVGWSHGGETVLEAVTNNSLHDPVRLNTFAAAIAFYPLCPFKLRRLDAPLLVLIGDADDWTPARNCESMTLQGETTRDFELVVYAGATHGFDFVTNPTEYLGFYMEPNPEAKEDAYRRLVEFLALHLQSP